MRGAWLAALALASCVSRGAEVEASWTGADTGAIAMDGTAQWCAGGQYLEIRATRGDTGVAIALFPADTSYAGRYTLLPDPSDSPRPVAAVALRWSVETAVHGFQSDSGTIMVRREPDGRLAGEVQAAGRLVGGDRLHVQLRAAFRDLAVGPAPDSCPPLLIPSRLHLPDGSDLLPQGLRAQDSSRGPAQ